MIPARFSPSFSVSSTTSTLFQNRRRQSGACSLEQLLTSRSSEEPASFIGASHRSPSGRNYRTLYRSVNKVLNANLQDLIDQLRNPPGSFTPAPWP